MSDQREQIEQLFEAALALEPQARAHFLDEACRPELRAAVEELLALDDQAGSFLQKPAADCLNRITASGAAELSGSSEGNGRIPPPPFEGRLRPGDVLVGRFAIVRFIARGGMGEVYEAEDRFLQGVHVALKTILPSMAEDPSLKERFEREVMLAQQVTHANLCPIYAIFRHEQPSPSFLFLTMKLLAGETLATRLHRPYKFPAEEAYAIVRQLAAGLLAIHEAGIIHRDIKPSNIMLEGTGASVRLWITDFGLARAFEPEITALSKGQVAGTPAYLAPELLMGNSPSQATDLFALGVVVHEVVTAQKPRIQANGHSVLPSPLLKSADAPAVCVQLAAECLSDDPERRCRAFERALEALQIRTSGTGFYNPPKPVWTRRSFGDAAVAS
jgi:serine/threonine protein kinase